MNEKPRIKRVIQRCGCDALLPFALVYVALAMMGVAVGAQFCQNILYTHGNIGDLYSSGTIFWMNVTVGVKVITGIGSISLLMISLLAGKDIDTTD